MFNKTVDNYPHALEFVPEFFKDQKMYDKAVDTHPSTIKFFLEYYKTQEMCDEVVKRCFLYLILFLISIRLKKCVAELFRKTLF